LPRPRAARFRATPAPSPNTYATGKLGSGSHVGGLVGYNNGSVATSWTDGAVPTGSTSGGLVGLNGSSGSLTDLYWDEKLTGQTRADGAGSGGTSTSVTGIGGSTGKSPDAQATYVGFDFTTTWSINAGSSRPYLQGVSPQPTPQ
jgi:hypothetical protein